MRFGPFLASTVLLTLLTVTAKADSVSYPVTGSGGGVDGSGTLTASLNTNGSYTITDITGTGVEGLIAPTGFHGNDNLLFPGSTPVLDPSGFAFLDSYAGTAFQVDIYADSASATGYEAYFVDSENVAMPLDVTFALGSGTPTTASGAHSAFLRAAAAEPATETFQFSFSSDTAAVTPEPSSFALLGTGFLGIAGLLRKRMRG